MHCNVQVTPPGGISFVTAAMTCACVLAVRFAGGSRVYAIVGGWRIVIDVAAGFEGVAAGAAEDALMATTPPEGAEAGAVYIELTV